MRTKRNGYQIRIIVLALAVLSTIVIIMTSCKKEPDEQARVEARQPHAATTDKSQSSVESVRRAEPVPTAIASKAPEASKIKLDDVIRAAKNWEPIFKSYRDMPAPDFMVTDLTGKEHTLSQYKGTNVMLIIWAPWCGPCKAEIPHLVELRAGMPDNELTMLAISFTSSLNTIDNIKEFVAQNQTINYPVIAADATSLPKPYSLVEFIPSNIFIGPDGNIKLATRGMMPLSDIKAIFLAR